MVGTLLSPPRLTPRRRSVRPASSLNQLPSGCSIALLERSPCGTHRTSNACRKWQEIEDRCRFITGQPEQVYVLPIVLQNENLVSVTCQGYLPPPERLVTGTVAPDDGHIDLRCDGTPEHQGSVFTSPLDRLSDRHKQFDGVGVFPLANDLEGPRAVQDKLGEREPERCRNSSLHPGQHAPQVRNRDVQRRELVGCHVTADHIRPAAGATASPAQRGHPLQQSQKSSFPLFSCDMIPDTISVSRAAGNQETPPVASRTNRAKSCQGPISKNRRARPEVDGKTHTTVRPTQSGCRPGTARRPRNWAATVLLVNAST